MNELPRVANSVRSSGRRARLLGLAAALCCGEALANDSTANLAIGGLVFVRNDAVEMRQEELTISAREIDVRYRFYNASDKDVSSVVAFPLAEITGAFEANISVPTEDAVNIVDFATSVDGKTIAAQVEQRVLALGVDRTQILRDLGVPLAPHLQSTGQALDKLPREKWDELKRQGLADVEEYDAGKGMEKHLAPRWTLRTTFYWDQIFPSKREIVIEHRYKPSVGQSFFSRQNKDARRQLCFDKEFDAGIERAFKGKEPTATIFNAERIDYILETGANWAGPIKDFRLVVDKESPDNLVSFCGDGVKKISPTKFEMRKTDFWPTQNLSVLILKRMKEQPEGE